MLEKAFSKDRKNSSIVLVFSRNDEQSLSEAEQSFITETIKPQLAQLKDSNSQGPILEVKSFDDEETGEFFISNDKRSALVVIELSLGTFDQSNAKYVAEVERELERLTGDERAIGTRGDGKMCVENGPTAADFALCSFWKSNTMRGQGCSLWTIMDEFDALIAMG